MEIAGFGLRDIVLAVLALVGVYVAVMVLRLLQVGKRKTARLPATEPAAPATAGGADIDADEEDAVVEPVTYARPPAAPPPPAGNVRSFNAELNRTQLEREVKNLREEVAALRSELEGFKAASRVSPQYSDAMALVQRGMTAQDVADRCNISLAEAELVCALARGPQQFDEEVDDGIDTGPRSARIA